MESRFDPRTIAAGELIGPYTVLSKLGEGGFGATYLCEREGARYAVKVSFPFDPNREETPQDRSVREARAKREFAALNLLDHPNIVRVEGFERHKGTPYLVMGYVEGRRLRDWAREERPKLRRVLELFRKLALALSYMHERGYWHRDIKSGNVMVRPDDEPVLIDFGIAKPKSAFTVTRFESLVGTYSHLSPEYVNWFGSPEWNRGERFVFSAQTDLYALGCMLYSLLTGRSPYDGEKTSDLLLAIRLVVPKPPSRFNEAIPTELDELVLKLLRKEPEQRHQSGKELAEALAVLLQGQGEKLEKSIDPLAAPNNPKTRAASPRGKEGRSPESASGQAIAVGSKDIVATDVIAVQAPIDEERTEEQPVVVRRLEVAGAEDASWAGGARQVPSPAEGGRAAGDEPRGSVSPKVLLSAEDAKAAPAKEKSEFRAPTLDRPAFAPPEAPVQEQVSKSVTGVGVVQAQAGESDRRKPPSLWLGGVGLLVLVVLIFALPPLLRGYKANHPSEGKPLALASPPGPAPVALEAVGPPARPLVIPASALSAQVPTSSAVPAPDPARPGEGANTAPAPPTSVSTSRGRTEAQTGRVAGARPRRRSPDAQAVDELLAASYGDPARAQPETKKVGGAEGHPAKAAAKEPAHPAWLKVGQRIDVASAPAPGEASALGVPMGQHLAGILKTNLDSRTTSDGFVEALISQAVVVGGKERIPAGTMAYGVAAPSGRGRFTLRFTRLRFPDDTEREFSGLAVDRDEKKPGLPASRTIAAERRPKESLASKVAKNGANQALASVQGGVAEDMARTSAQTVINDTGDDGESAQDVLLLDAPYAFDLFITKAF